MIINNDTVIKNNTLARINAVEGKYEWGFSFGNNSGNRFMEIIQVNMTYLTNITNDMQHLIVFVYGNRNYGRIVVRDNVHNLTDLYRSEEKGFFRALYVID